MKLQITKNGTSLINFKLTSADIEQQVTIDLLRFNKKWRSKYKQALPSPLDVDAFIKLLWDIDVAYDDLQQSENEEVLGFFEPTRGKITIDAQACNNKRRISFTVAHEAGHLSLHSFLFNFKDGKVIDWKNKKRLINKNLDRQADLYAASLLAPKQDVYNFLIKNDLIVNNVLVAPINLSIYASLFQEQFGLSRQALEIRLCRLGLSATNKKYVD